MREKTSCQETSGNTCALYIQARSLDHSSTKLNVTELGFPKQHREGSNNEKKKGAQALMLPSTRKSIKPVAMKLPACKLLKQVLTC